MLNLQYIKVHVFNSDIADMVLNISMFETIKGNIRGSMTVQDNINFMDTFISTAHAPIKIEWQYQGRNWINHFYGDGIENMEISKLGKKYVIHFIAYTTLNEQVKRINNTYSGRGDQIITDIFREANGGFKDAPFRLDSKSITKGRYIVPNIKAQQALNNVVNSCYDKNKTSLLLYQRVCDQGATRLTSLYDMNENEYGVFQQIGTATYKKTFKLEAALAGADEESDGLNSSMQIGTVSQFVMPEFNMNFAQKVAAGFYGTKVQHVQLDETSTKTYPIAEYTDIPITSYKLQNNLYDNNIKSIFSLSCEPESHAMVNQRRRVFNQRMNAMNTVAVPGLGVGYSIETDSGGSNISQSKTDTKYIIATLNHKFSKQDGEFQYSQDIGLIRDGSTE